MTKLFVCQAIGDTNAQIKVAKRLLEKDSEQRVMFLPVGWPALIALKKAGFSDERFAIKEIQDLDYTKQQFSVDEVGLVMGSLEGVDIDGILVGTPSPGFETTFQIAEKLAERLPGAKKFMFVDYLFTCRDDQDPENILGRLVTKREIKDNYPLLLPTKISKAWLAEKASSIAVKAEVVGHPDIDEVLREEPLDEASKASVLDEVGAVGQKLIFISALKTVQDDLKMLKAMYEALEEDRSSSQQFSDVQIRLGMHPGTSDKIGYVKEILSWLKKKEGCAQFKIIVSRDLEEELNDEKLAEWELFDVKSTLIFSDLRGGKVSAAASGVACAVPATLVNKSSVTGAAYCHDQTRCSVLPENRFFSGKEALPLFFRKVVAGGGGAAAGGVVPRPSREELGVAEEEMVDIVAKKYI